RAARVDEERAKLVARRRLPGEREFDLGVGGVLPVHRRARGRALHAVAAALPHEHLLVERLQFGGDLLTRRGGGALGRRREEPAHAPGEQGRQGDGGSPRDEESAAGQRGPFVASGRRTAVTSIASSASAGAMLASIRSRAST